MYKRQAKSHALTTEVPLKLDAYNGEDENPRLYALTGTPSDCMKFGLSYLLTDDMPDLVISGINHGFNLGSDVSVSYTHLDVYKRQLLTGSTTKKEKERIYEGLADGSIHMIIGTHALIQEGVNFHNLGLVIIDEQHRFGVEQRARLQQKGTDVYKRQVILRCMQVLLGMD